MSQFTLHRINPDILREMDLPDYPLPVRKAMESEVCRSDHVDLPLLVDELSWFLLENKECRAAYRKTLSSLSYLVGTMMGKQGYPETAAHYFELGLWINPENLCLRSDHALALYAQGKIDEAQAEYDLVISEAGIVDPRTWLMAARICAEKGDYKRACQLLHDCAAYLPLEDSFWEFLADMNEKAGLNRPSKTEEEIMAELNLTEIIEQDVSLQPTSKIAVAAKPDRTCPCCQTDYVDEDRYCANCGCDLRNARSICKSCGSEVEEDDLYCATCGSKLNSDTITGHALNA